MNSRAWSGMWLGATVLLGACTEQKQAAMGDDRDKSSSSDAQVHDCALDPAAVDGGGGGDGADTEVLRPTYGADGKLQRPAGIEKWVFLGAAVNLSYTEQEYASDLLSNVFMEPGAFDVFMKTGEFPEGTMTALKVYAGDADAEPARHGLFGGKQVAFEMSVKDSERFPDEVWAYYGFGLDDEAAEALPPQTCHACHAEHAGTDFVFSQFYPVLRDRR